MKRLVLWALALLGYSFFSVVVFAVANFAVSWGMTESTEVVNHLSEDIEITPIGRLSSNYWPLQSHSVMPPGPGEHYLGLKLKVGQSHVLLWDTDDQSLNGFIVKLEGKTEKYFPIEKPNKRFQSRPDKKTYYIVKDALIDSMPAPIEPITPEDRANIQSSINLKLVFWVAFFSPNLFLFFQVCKFLIILCGFSRQRK